MAATPPNVTKAKLYSVKEPSNCVTVHFNPTSLVYSVENATPQQGGDPKSRQFAGQFTGKLTMDLQFDTTDRGDDVRIDTNKIANFLQPAGSTQPPGGTSQTPAKKSGSNPPKAQPVVCFQWGKYTFQGILESFRETIDFFSAEGVPLRALVSIGLARQDQVFPADSTTTDKSSVNGSANLVSEGSLVPSSAGASALSMATRGGDPSAARQLAFDNGMASMRFTTGASLQVNAGVQLKPAAGFAASASIGGGLGLSLGAGAGVSAGAGISVGGGAGASIGGSAGITAGAGLSISAGASVSSGPVFGSSASAGVPATAGAFAGLETGRAQISSTAQLDTSMMMRSTTGASVATFNGASFTLGGAAKNSSSSGLAANVGSTFSFRDRLTFDSDD